jgi:uncharacterized membrane protein
MLLIYAILFGVFFIFILEEKFAEHPKIKPGQSGVFSIAAVFLYLGTRHFLAPAEYADMVPLAEGLRLPLVYAVGAFQAVAAVLLLVWRTQKAAAAALILFQIAAMPVHFYGAVHSVGPDHTMGPMYVVLRMPMELFLTWWIWRYGTFKTPLRELRDPAKLVG